MFADFTAGIALVADELDLPTPLPPVSAIGVDFLFEPDVLVELEAYAILDEARESRSTTRGRTGVGRVAYSAISSSSWALR